MNIISGKKPYAVLDAINHRYIIRNIGVTGITPGAALRAVKATHVSWRYIAEFFGLDRQSVAFKAAYKSHAAEQAYLANFITVSGDQAFFYDKDHQPESVNNPKVHPTIVNNEPNGTKVTAKVPANITGRIVIKDPIDRSLRMTLTTTNGILNGTGKLYINPNGGSIVLRGNAARLTRYLREITFVGAAAGNGSIAITVNDLGGTADSIVQTSVNVVVQANKVDSVPELRVPTTKPTVVLNVKTVIEPPVTVADADKKLLKLKICPFGCDVLNFKNYIGYLKSGVTETVYGTPDYINEYLAQMQVRAYQTNAQVGFELSCGRYKVRKYLVTNVITEEEATDPTDQSNSLVGTAQVGSGTVGTEPDATNNAAPVQSAAPKNATTTTTTTNATTTTNTTNTTTGGKGTTTTTTATTNSTTPKDTTTTTTPKTTSGK